MAMVCNLGGLRKEDITNNLLSIWAIIFAHNHVYTVHL
jgi:hypothetical protein